MPPGIQDWTKDIVITSYIYTYSERDGWKKAYKRNGSDFAKPEDLRTNWQEAISRPDRVQIRSLWSHPIHGQGWPVQYTSPRESQEVCPRLEFLWWHFLNGDHKLHKFHKYSGADGVSMTILSEDALPTVDEIGWRWFHFNVDQLLSSSNGWLSRLWVMENMEQIKELFLKIRARSKWFSWQ